MPETDDQRPARLAPTRAVTSDAADAWFVTVDDGTKIYTEVHGKQSEHKVLLLMGFAASLVAWAPQVRPRKQCQQTTASRSLPAVPFRVAPPSLIRCPSFPAAAPCSWPTFWRGRTPGSPPSASAWWTTAASGEAAAPGSARPTARGPWPLMHWRSWCAAAAAALPLPPGGQRKYTFIGYCAARRLGRRQLPAASGPAGRFGLGQVPCGGAQHGRHDCNQAGRRCAGPDGLAHAHFGHGRRLAGARPSQDTSASRCAPAGAAKEHPSAGVLLPHAAKQALPPSNPHGAPRRLSPSLPGLPGSACAC